VLRGEILKVLPADPLPAPSASGLLTILIAGVNGTGKTTLVCEACRLAQGPRPLLSTRRPLDTVVRAAAIEQLCAWGAKLGIEVVRSQYQGDAAALCHDAWKQTPVAATSNFSSCDTAGRLHTKGNLMPGTRQGRSYFGKASACSPA
jgi:fused signal recognition particle receptor